MAGLVKRARTTYHPPVAGRPAVPAQTVCPPPRPDGPPVFYGRGRWERRCSVICTYMGDDSQGKPIIVCTEPVCRSVWVRVD